MTYESDAEETFESEDDDVLTLPVYDTTGTLIGYVPFRENADQYDDEESEEADELPASVLINTKPFGYALLVLATVLFFFVYCPWGMAQSLVLGLLAALGLLYLVPSVPRKEG